MGRIGVGRDGEESETVRKGRGRKGWGEEGEGEFVGEREGEGRDGEK